MGLTLEKDGNSQLNGDLTSKTKIEPGKNEYFVPCENQD